MTFKLVRTEIDDISERNLKYAFNNVCLMVANTVTMMISACVKGPIISPILMVIICIIAVLFVINLVALIRNGQRLNKIKKKQMKDIEYES